MPIPLAAAPVVAKASPFVAPLIAGGVSALGSIGASLIGAHSAKSQMRFQERMSGTSHQREMADLKKAGLNPLLTGKYGGSSTPPGTSFTPDNPLSKASDTAINMKMLQANLRNIDQTVMTNSALEDKYYTDSTLNDQRTHNEITAGKLLQLQIPSAKAEAKMWDALGGAGKGAQYGGTGLKALTPFFLQMLKMRAK